MITEISQYGYILILNKKNYNPRKLSNTLNKPFYSHEFYNNSDNKYIWRSGVYIIYAECENGIFYNHKQFYNINELLNFLKGSNKEDEKVKKII